MDNRQIYSNYGGGRFLSEMCAAASVHEFLRELAAVGGVDSEEPWLPLGELVSEVAYLHLLSEGGAERLVERAILHLRPVGPSEAQVEILRQLVTEVYAGCFGFDVTPYEPSPEGDRYLVVTGAVAAHLARLEAGTHLFWDRSGTIHAVEVLVHEVAPGDDVGAVATAYRAQQTHWLDALARGEATLDDDPSPLGAVVRVYDEAGSTLDLRTGTLVGAARPTPQAHRAFLLSQLPISADLLA